MKYIRTKKGKIYCFVDIHIVGDTIIGYIDDKNKNALDGGTYLEKENVLVQADTIEELCDEFVVIVDGKHYIRVPASNPNFQTYGAIWTDKGLIYIAKMNDKGELELL